ncbi:Uncharacterised protein [Sphingobacterium multivorum]|jgi:hypothetical protein|uniref:Uncharacterized protein n=2 Tax=Sphingobacterium TaxID=28453 RepID=A0A654C8J1_SPHMU|nr:hypothetical protein [Sphingobacterium sp. UBA7253]TWI16406.1 hypothetical protein IQ31_04404 [Sphingobacterium siyangense]SUJ12368.1 Uncharacterised protein [Sphingobacterium multivorum]VXC89213.1 conserved hypothetical protein [Sphingobacterium multivorum]
MEIKKLLKFAAVVVVLALIVYVIMNSSAFIDAFNEGYNRTRNK